MWLISLYVIITERFGQSDWNMVVIENETIIDHSNWQNVPLLFMNIWYHYYSNGCFMQFSILFLHFLFYSDITTYPLYLIRCPRQQMAPGLWSLPAQTWDLLPQQWTKSPPAASWLEPIQRLWSRCWWCLKRKCAIWRRKRYRFLSVTCQLKHN